MLLFIVLRWILLPSSFLFSPIFTVSCDGTWMLRRIAQAACSRAAGVRGWVEMRDGRRAGHARWAGVLCAAGWRCRSRAGALCAAGARAGLLPGARERGDGALGYGGWLCARVTREVLGWWLPGAAWRWMLVRGARGEAWAAQLVREMAVCARRARLAQKWAGAARMGAGWACCSRRWCSVLFEVVALGRAVARGGAMRGALAGVWAGALASGAVVCRA